MDLYELVYFRRPTDPANDADDSHGAAEIRFKDAAACLTTFRIYIKLRIRCLITRCVYAQAKTSDLSVKKTTDWNVRSCKPRLRREQVGIVDIDTTTSAPHHHHHHRQVASGLSTLDGVSDTLGRTLASHIPSDLLPATIETVIQYCCKNYCRSCKGARLHGGVQVKGFLPIPRGKGYMIRVNEFKNPKPNYCEWRLAKRRVRDEEGKLLPLGNMHTHIQIPYMYIIIRISHTH